MHGFFKKKSKISENFRIKHLTNICNHVIIFAYAIFFAWWRLYFNMEVLMSKKLHTELSKRERQIMDVVYEQGRASAAEIQERLPDPPSYSAVRALLRVLEEKGHLRHRAEGPRYIYEPVLPRDKAKRSALQRVLKTFFDGSAEQAVAALIDLKGTKLSDEELSRLGRLIEQARRKENRS